MESLSEDSPFFGFFHEDEDEDEEDDGDDEEETVSLRWMDRYFAYV
ncbi:hypothetical protein ACFVP0_26100 [Streptomyces cinereoruber]